MVVPTKQEDEMPNYLCATPNCRNFALSAAGLCEECEVASTMPEQVPAELAWEDENFARIEAEAEQAQWEFEAEAARAEAVAEAQMAYFDYEPSPYYGDYSEM